MKHQKTKFLTLTLAAALGAVALGTGAILAGADETTSTSPSPALYSAADVFSASSLTVIDTSADTVAFKFVNEGNVTLTQRDLAWKWYTQKSDKATYLNFKLQFADLYFDTVTVNLETAAATANSDNKAINKLVFTNKDGVVYASVNDSDPIAQGKAVNVADKNTISVSVDQESVEYGEYNVTVNDGTDHSVGKFTNVGAAYGEYAASTAATPLTPFKIEAKLLSSLDKSIDKTEVRLVEINGQSFALENGKITDNAKPVLVVNDEIQSMMLGTAFSLDFDFVDVLDKTVQKKIEYVQYNPTVAAEDVEYKDISTNYSTTYFYDTAYEKQDGTLTSVWAEEKQEYISVRFYLSDEFYKDDTKVEYDLAWYASKTATKDGKDYIILDRNVEGATYTFLNAVADKDSEGKELETGKNLVSNTEIIDDYQDLVTKAAENLKAGSKTNFYLPTMVGMIADNGGYTNLKFTISYRSTNASSPSTRSSLTSSNLQFPVSKSGTYQFKVFAVDKAGNSMMYYDEDGELVKISTSNVWEIEEIPYFEFTISETSLSIEDNESKDSGRKDSVAVGETFDDFDLNVLGDSGADATIESKLYRIDFDKFNKIFPNKTLSIANIASVTYKSVDEAALEKLTNLSKEDYAKITDFVDVYLEAYATALAEKIGVDAQDLINANIFIEIEPFNDKINEEDHADEFAKNNVYHWNAENRSFVAANENDVYFMLAVYTDKDIASLKASGYKVVSVEAEDDVLPGETEWLKNNVASVILFSVAGLMLILIVIVLLVKPSDESLEDVEENAKKKDRKRKRKSKKNKK